jgi:hypothetical protein
MWFLCTVGTAGVACGTPSVPLQFWAQEIKGFYELVWQCFVTVWVAQVIEVVEVLHHAFDDLRVIAFVIGVPGFLIIALSRFQLDGAACSILQQVNTELGIGLNAWSRGGHTLKVPCLNAVLK